MTPASPPKQILIVGAGSIGLKHLRAFRSVDADLTLSVIDPRPEARDRAEQLGARTVETDWDSLDISRFHGVVICAPPPLHIPYARRCLEEGVPVLSEKPLSHSLDGVDQLVEMAGSDGAAPSGVAYVRRYIPMHRDARRIIDSGKLGPLLSLRISAGQPFTTYRPDYRDIYYASRDQGGGCVLDFASHFVDLAQWYLGPIASMNGYARHLALQGVDVEDTAAISFEFDNGALGVLHVNQFQPMNENCLHLCGPEACLRLIEPSWKCLLWRKGSQDWEEIPTEPGDYAEGLTRQAAAFLEAAEGGPPMRTSFAEAAHTLRLCLGLLSEQQKENRT